MRGYILELPVAQISIEILVLGIRRFNVRRLYFGINVAVTDQNVEPAIVVRVEEANPPAEIPGIDTQTRTIGLIFKVTVALVGIQRIGIAGEVCLDYVEQAIAIEVTDTYPMPACGFPSGE